MTADIKASLEQYFLSNWTSTPIQFEGIKFDYSGKTNWISLVLAPAFADRYGFDGTATGRVRYVGIQKVFCYAKNPTKAFQLADSVKTFLNGLQIGGSVIDLGQDGTALDLQNGYFEVVVNFEYSNFS